MKLNLGRGESVGMKGYFHSNQWLYLLILISSSIALIASFQLSVDAWVLAANPGASLDCDINEVVSCSKVALTWQANLLGFPNAYLGLMFEPVVLAVAAAGISGGKFPRWFMLVAQIIYTIALLFAWWLFFQSSFVIYSLCPWCLLITVFTSITFFSLLHVNVRDDNLFLPRSLQRAAEAMTRARFTEMGAAFLVLMVFVIIFSLYGLALFGL